MVSSTLPLGGSTLCTQSVTGRRFLVVTEMGFWLRGVLLACIVLLCGAGEIAVRAADTARSPDEAYLDALQGTWTMAGTLRGKPVRYVADGQRVLQDGFVKLHMMDGDSRPPYEADVFIGFDAKANDYIAHWLDRFGAPGARSSPRVNGMVHNWC
jgi:hypothetical protein